MINILLTFKNVLSGYCQIQSTGHVRYIDCKDLSCLRESCSVNRYYPDSAINIAPSAVIDPTVLSDNVHIKANVIEAGDHWDNVQLARKRNGKNAIGEILTINKRYYCRRESCRLPYPRGNGYRRWVCYANEKYVKSIPIKTLVLVTERNWWCDGHRPRSVRGYSAVYAIIDNLCHIAHNVKIGENTVRRRQRCRQFNHWRYRDGWAQGINGHTEVADNCHFSAYAMVTKPRRNRVYPRYSCRNAKDWRKNIINCATLQVLKTVSKS